MTTLKKKKSTGLSKREQWFDELIATLRSHEVQLESGVATSELTSFYNKMMAEDYIPIAADYKQKFSKALVSHIIINYLNTLSKKKKQPSKLAFDYNDSNVLVWAVIPDDDETLEDALILTEAKINAECYKYGFQVTSTIIEESDAIDIPSHYSTVIN